MSTQLPQAAENYFIDQLLLPSWQPANAVGYDPGSQPGDEAFLPVATSLDDVGEVSPHLTVQRTNETAGGETGYDFLTSSGPGQNRTGQLLVTARAEDDRDYAGAGSFATVTASTLVDTLIDEVEGLCLRNATAAGTELTHVGAFRGADAPDDFDAEPTVRVEQCVVQYGWIREP